MLRPPAQSQMEAEDQAAQAEQSDELMHPDVPLSGSAQASRKQTTSLTAESATFPFPYAQKIFFLKQLKMPAQPARQAMRL